MTHGSLGGTPADPTDDLYFDRAWTRFTRVLGEVLRRMNDPDEGDHLILKLPDPEDGSGCAPYAQFVGFDRGLRLRAEICGEAYLSPSFLGGGIAANWMTMMAWSGNDPDDLNWFKQMRITDADELARVSATSLREGFGIAHPDLLSCRAWGPNAAAARALGLRTEDSPGPPATARLPAAAWAPLDHDNLVDMVQETLTNLAGPEPVEIDDDGDFVLAGAGQPIWVRVRQDVPAVVIMAVPTYDVDSRRQAVVELAILNRDSVFGRWSLRERAVWQMIDLPGTPFVPAQLQYALEAFRDVLVSTRGDLAMRTGGKLAC